MLSNLETEKSKLLQIVLVGQPNLRDKLAAPELEQLRQRITVSYHLSPLDSEETAKYINHRLRRASIGAPLEFPRDVTDIVHTRSRGVPRIINVICDATLVFGYAEERRQIDAGLMADVLVELEATGVLPPVRTAAETTRQAVPAGAVSAGDVNSPSVVPVAPAILPQSAPAAVAQPDVAATYAAARALLEEAKSRAAQLDQREQMLRQRERELADQRRVLAEEYRLLRTRPTAPPPPATRVGGPSPAFAPVGPGAGSRTEGARFTPVRHETAWARIKRLMLGNTSSALEEN
jgi:hypothetical protein